MIGGKRGARTGLKPSFFDVRPDNQPAWPTFRGATLDGEEGGQALVRLGNLAHLVYYATGSRIEHELPNGGLSRAGEPHEYPLASFELRRWVRRLDNGKRTPLYFLCWIGGYGKGSILHIAPQFPHVCERDLADVEFQAFDVYCAVAQAVYGPRVWDREVIKFVEHGKDLGWDHQSIDE